MDFSTDQIWTVRDISQDKSRGTWTQCVHELSDARRYCGTGKWSYDNGIATRTSDMTACPLPRREYTKRDDYNVVMGINRRTITPNGWTHEQFNTKVMRRPDGTHTELVREFGFNDYRKTTEIDFKPAYDYWSATKDFWAVVRGHWDGLLSQAPGVHLKTKIDGMAMIIPLFEYAETLQKGGRVDDSQIDSVFAEWAEPANATLEER